MKSFLSIPQTLLALFALTAIVACTPSQQQSETTLCNPVNISYRFGLEDPSRREAADPTIVWFKDRYFLFASKSGGYWHSADLAQWTFVETNQIPTEEYAPTAIAIGDTLFFLASSNELSTIYKSTNPTTGQWQVAVPKLDMPVWDPAFFMDDDNRLYLLWGCSDARPLYGVEVDYANHFAFKSAPIELMYANTTQNGWEVPGDNNTRTKQAPWIEGPWMTKHYGKYYLQYSGPGTEYKSYSDGMYVSNSPLGPFTLQAHNPFAYKPGGFAAGAGHGSTFADQHGNWWHIGTATISQKHMFERRLSIFPAFIDEDGEFYANTRFGDYPYRLPNKKISSQNELFMGWMLLSYKKTVEVSSMVDSLPATNMVDEDIRTYWAAQGGGDNEYAIVDLGEQYDVYAVQVNFAEHNTNLFGLQKTNHHKYTVEYSNDGTTWSTLIEKTSNNSDHTHDYTALSQKTTCRYLKLNNKQIPDGHFAVSGFRVFGLGKGQRPGLPQNLLAERNQADRRSVQLSWDRAENVTGYNILFGTAPTKLYQSFMTHSDTSLTINSLNAAMTYYFSIEAFNENGITTNTEIIVVK
jgi:xylan 1,4-beta-xylosidase